MAVSVETGFPVSADVGGSSGTTITTAAFSTAGASVLVALVSSQVNGAAAATCTGITTAGLTWTQVVQVATQTGILGLQSVSIWRAISSGALTTVTAQAAWAANQWDRHITVLSLLGADTTTPIGGSATANANSTAPNSVSVLIGGAGSLLVGVNYRQTFTAPTLDAASTLLNQTGSASVWYEWSQRRTNVTTAGEVGTSLAIGSTGPTDSASWSSAGAEILALAAPPATKTRPTLIRPWWHRVKRGTLW